MAAQFHERLLGTKAEPGTSLLSVALPFSVDWEGMTLHPGFILPASSSFASFGNFARTKGSTLFVEFPDVEGWLEDDFTQAMMAQIELAETVFRCHRIILGVDREAISVLRSLKYVGFKPVDLGPSVSAEYVCLHYETECSTRRPLDQ